MTKPANGTTRPAAAAEQAQADVPVSAQVGGHYRPDIEGMRALAILAVLAFHARLPGVSGGFVGVDIFYVISGFLITGLLVREYASNGRIDLPTFYARRARRLLPAALAVILVTLVASWFVLTAIDFPNVAGDGAAAALYVSNYRFALTATDYFANDLPPSPLLHYWSLGVEEQFYLVWPLLMIVGARLLSARRLWLLVAVVAIVSFASSVIVTGIEAPWAFYSLPTRAWQLALGGLVALGVLSLPRRWPSGAASILGLLGVALIVAALVVINNQTPYPGLAAVLPSAGATLLIIAGGHGRTWTSRLLGTPIPRWFGRISYSLYLWHWPVLILVPQLIDRHGLRARLALAVAAIALAALSERFVERPFRFGFAARYRARRALVLAGSSCAMVTAIAAASVLPIDSSAVVAQPLPTLAPVTRTQPQLPAAVLSGPIPADLQPPLETARADGPRVGAYGCRTDYTDVALADCVYGDPGASTTVVLYGDSHAAMWLPGLEALAGERDWRILVLLKPSCTFVETTVWSSELQRPFDECNHWRNAALEKIASEHPQITFVAGTLNYRLAGPGGPVAYTSAQWQQLMTASLSHLSRLSGRVVMFAETPHHGVDPVKCLARNQRVEACETARKRLLNTRYSKIERKATRQAGVTLLPVTDWVCGDTACPLIMDRYVVFRDKGHLTATFAYVLAPQIRWVLDNRP